ncbi:MAG: gliding motility-associated C-terminal domain-containing protein [Flavobacteriales bacterium]
MNNTGYYSLTVTDTFSCSAKDTVHVNFKAYPIVDLLNGEDSVSICEGETIALNATYNGATYLWNVQATSPIIVVDNTGTYSVKVSNGNCSVFDTVYVKEVILPKNILSEFTNAMRSSHCFAEEGSMVISLDTTASSYTYLWNTGETTSSIEIAGGGVYKVVVNEGNCAVSDEVKVLDYCPTTFYIPNAFTPNGDGNNNQFMAVGSNVNDFEMLIFNRWGEQIFRSTDINLGWDGTYLNHLVQQDVYVYKILYSVNNE